VEVLSNNLSMRLIKSSLLLIVVLLSFTVTSQVVIDTFYTRVSSGGSDAMIASGVLKNKNFKNKKTVNVFQKNPENNSVVFRSLLDFDLTQIPIDAIIVEAKLYLTPKTVNNNHNHPIYIERINESWDRNTIKWNNQPRVNHSDKLFFPHSVTETNTTHEFDIKKHIQKMVSFPTSNFGMRLRLKNEFIAVPTGFGVRYHAANSISNSNHPRLAVSYVMPIEITATVQHCTVGNNDGSITATIVGGSQNYTQFKWYNYDMGQVSLLTTGTDFTTLPLTNITNGLYLLQVKDDFNTIGYQYVLVGKEGITTTVQFHNDNPNNTLSKKYNEDALIKYKYQANVGNKNYKHNKYSNAEDNARNKFYSSSLLSYNVDFDNQLDFTSANLSLICNTRGHLRQDATVSNAGYLSRVTSNWNEKVVTWNTKPSISTTDQTAIAETTPTGLVVRNDSFDILNYVNHWRDNPNENFGIELSLQNYGALKNSRLSYYSYDVSQVNRRPVFELSFDVKSRLTTTFDEQVNKGEITINAPNGDLPYKYVVDTRPILSLQNTWDLIKDSIPLIDGVPLFDSLAYFQSNGATTDFQFNNLAPGKYFVAVFDNTGQEIFQESIIVSPEIRLAYSLNLIKGADGYYSVEDSVLIEASGIVLLELQKEKEGGIAFTLKNISESIFGFNYLSDTIVNDSSDIIFGIHIINSSEFQVISNGVQKQLKYPISSNDELIIVKEKNNFVVYINNVLIYSEQISYTLNENLKFNTQLKGPIKLLLQYPIFIVPPVPNITITYPECGNSEGEIVVSIGQSAGFWSLSNLNVTLIDFNTNLPIQPSVQSIPGQQYIFDAVDIGIYNLIYTWDILNSLAVFPISQSVVNNQIAIGYVVDWTTSANTMLDGGINSITTTTISNSGPTHSGYKTMNSQDNWVQFESQVNNYIYNWVSTPFKFQRFDMVPSSNTAPSGSTAVGIFSHNLNILPNTIIYKHSPIATTFYSIPADNEFRIHQNNSGFKIYDTDVNAPFFQNSTYVGANNQISLYLRAFQTKKTHYHKIISSFCVPDLEVINNGYFRLEKSLDGGYYQVNNNSLLFEVDVDYNMQVGTYLDYNIYSTNMQLIAGSSSNGTITVGGAPLLLKNISENGYNLDVSSIGLIAGYYVLETINSKQEKAYIKFKID